MAKVQGNPSTFEPNPFMIHMADGAFIGKKAPAAAGKKAPAKSTAKSTTKKKK